MTTTEPDTRTAWDLVTAAQAGDTDAFGQLWEQHREMVFRYVLFRTSDRQLAEDLTSETFLRAWKRIDTVSYQGRDIGAWLVTIARNLVLDHFKSSHTRRTTLIGPGEPFWETALAGSAPALPEQRALEQETVDQLDRMVSTLNPGQQAAIRHRFYDGLSRAETAELMGCKEGAMAAMQTRAIQSLARQVRPDARSVDEFTQTATLHTGTRAR